MIDFDYKLINQPEPSWHVKVLKLMRRLERHKSERVVCPNCGADVR